MQKSLFSSLLLASVSASLTAHAANNDEINLPETLVTATRSDTAKNELASASTVYTREDIERLQGNIDFWQDKVESLIKEGKQSNDAKTAMNRKIAEI